MRTYTQRAMRNVEVGEVVRFGGVHWMRVRRIEDTRGDGSRLAFYDTDDGLHSRTMERQADEVVHVLDVDEADPDWPQRIIGTMSNKELAHELAAAAINGESRERRAALEAELTRRRRDL